MLFTRDVPRPTRPDDAASQRAVVMFTDRGFRARGDAARRGGAGRTADGGGGMDERFGAEQGLVKS
ncbi:hypothetical protein Aau02nite_81150 [Amorphoplanes auranticolor]|uniref:Uncharacterized protein n=1 Tax=Actinoplanes auranticolor TaxID=47988 RepID=A0A919SWQ7_9ACTN|nr:hypothetical protein Aau02nite_81150 [Actinoplanes auranticolor]